MCSRYTFTDPQFILDELGVDGVDPDLVPRFNIAPTDLAPVVIVKGGKRVARLFRFGLVPSWAKDVRVGVRMLNARSETVATKAAFRGAIVNRRCIVAADGFIEWKKDGKKRLPFWFRDPSNNALALAGIWAAWNGPEGRLSSFSILTAPANDSVASVHDRMPIVLARSDRDRWLDPEVPLAGIEDLLRSPENALTSTRVSERVNKVANDDAECLHSPPQDDLFPY